MGNSTPDPSPHGGKFGYLKAITADTELTHAQFRVLTTLFNYSDEHLRNARPGVDRIIRESTCSRNAVKAALRVLEDRGYIVPVVAGGNRGGRGLATVYTLRLPVDNVSVGGPVSVGKGAHPVTETSPLSDTKGATQWAPNRSRTNHGSDQASNPPSSTSPGSPDRFACSKDEAWNTEPTPWDEEPEYDWSAA